MLFRCRSQFSILIVLLFRSSLWAKGAATDHHTLLGIWLPQSAQIWERGHLAEIRSSKLTIRADTFLLSNFRGTSTDIAGSFSVNPATQPSAIDLKVEPIDLSAAGSPVNYPAATVPGIFSLDGDVLTLCIQAGTMAVRPKTFASNLENEILLTFRRADPDFKDYPKQVMLTVVGPEGRPMADEHIFQYLRFWHDRKDPTSPRKWNYLYEIPFSGNSASAPYPDFRAAIVRDTHRNLIGFVTASPADLQSGMATIRLQPECNLSGTLTCEELTKGKTPLGWTNVYLAKNFERVAMCESTDGTFHFPVPPGKYMLDAYGTNFLSQCVQIEVPERISEFRPPPIEMVASHLAKLKGHMAPELGGIVGWKGQPVTLASLHGKWVLIDFWGYWCGPCVQAMPVLMDLQDKYGEKGLAIVSVHVDIAGEVDTAAKLDEKIAGFKKSIWSGRNLPFPTALSAGNNTPDGYSGVTSSQFGIHAYPTTILIDPEGKVVGEFEARKTVDASVAIEHLFDQGK